MKLASRRILSILVFALTCSACELQSQTTAPAAPPDSKQLPETKAEPPKQAPQAPASELDPAESDNTPKPVRDPKQSIAQHAWEILRMGVAQEHTRSRASAVTALALLPGEPEAAKLAIQALADKKPEVRKAGAVALGEMHAATALPQLEAALLDKEPSVVFAAAHSLVQMKDNKGYELYFAVLTGEHKSSKGVIAEQMDTFKDPKKLAMLGLQEGIGFVPFGGYGYMAVRMLMKDDSSPVRAAAARVLADDPDPKTQAALLSVALDDKHEVVRVAALGAIAHRGDPAMIQKIAPVMEDEKDAVSYNAAAAVLRLSYIAEHKPRQKKGQKRLPARPKP